MTAEDRVASCTAVGCSSVALTHALTAARKGARPDAPGQRGASLRCLVQSKSSKPSTPCIQSPHMTLFRARAI